MRCNASRSRARHPQRVRHVASRVRRVPRLVARLRRRDPGDDRVVAGDPLEVQLDGGSGGLRDLEEREPVLERDDHGRFRATRSPSRPTRRAAPATRAPRRDARRVRQGRGRARRPLPVLLVAQLLEQRPADRPEQQEVVGAPRVAPAADRALAEEAGGLAAVGRVLGELATEHDRVFGAAAHRVEPVLLVQPRALVAVHVEARRTRTRPRSTCGSASASDSYRTSRYTNPSLRYCCAPRTFSTHDRAASFERARRPAASPAVGRADERRRDVATVADQMDDSRLGRVGRHHFGAHAVRRALLQQHGRVRARAGRSRRARRR